MKQPTLTQSQQLAVISETVERIERYQEEAAKFREVMMQSHIEHSHKLDELARRMLAVEPVTQMVTSWHARAIGALMVMGFLGTLIGLGWVLLKDRLGAVWAAVTGT